MLSEHERRSEGASMYANHYTLDEIRAAARERAREDALADAQVLAAQDRADIESL